jgi:hypothetical protein
LHIRWFVIRWGGQRLREARMRRELGQLSLADGLVDGGAALCEKEVDRVGSAAHERTRAVNLHPSLSDFGLIVRIALRNGPRCPDWSLRHRPPGRGHGFPRSHGPAKRLVNGNSLTLG